MFDKFYSVKGIIKDSSNLSSVSEDHMLKIIKNISPNKATAFDSLPAKFIQDAATKIVSPLTHIKGCTIVQNGWKLQTCVHIKCGF